MNFKLFNSNPLPTLVTDSHTISKVSIFILCIKFEILFEIEFKDWGRGNQLYPEIKNSEFSKKIIQNLNIVK